MKSTQKGWFKLLGRFSRALVLWAMLISGIFLATRQVRADSFLTKTIKLVFKV